MNATESTGPQKPEPAPFASRVQLALVFLMGISFVMIAQQFNRDLYRWGVLSLIVFTLLQIAFGNIPEHYNFRRSMLSLLLAAVIIGAIVFISIAIVPSLLKLGR